MSPALGGKFFTTEPPGKPHHWLLGKHNQNHKGGSIKVIKKDMKKSESSCTTDKNVYGAVILENSLAVLQNVKYKVTTYVCLGVHPRETKAYVQTCTQNFMVALFMVKKKK